MTLRNPVAQLSKSRNDIDFWVTTSGWTAARGSQDHPASIEPVIMNILHLKQLSKPLIYLKYAKAKDLNVPNSKPDFTKLATQKKISWEPTLEMRRNIIPLK